MLNDTQLSMIKRGMVVKVRNQYQMQIPAKRCAYSEMTGAAIPI